MANAPTKKAEQATHQAIDQTRNFAEKAADKTKETAGTVAERAKEAASTIADKARDVTSSLTTSVTEGASNLASTAGHKADDAVAATGSGMQSLADTLRKNTPDEGMLGTASNQVADTLESGGKYLQEQGLSGMADDLSAMIKRYPIGAMLVGVGIGYILARATSRS